MADLILRNRQLKTINLQKVEATDQQVNFLVEPLVRAQNIENINLNYNKITGLFLDKYCKKVSQIGFTMNQNQGIDRNASTSLLASESEDTARANSLSDRLSGRRGSIVHQGLISLSMEGNELGDRGADAISQMIQTKSDSTKNLKMVNLNECSIGNVGFQKLKQALVQRGGLTKQFNLTHVGIKVERNSFDQ